MPMPTPEPDHALAARLIAAIAAATPDPSGRGCRRVSYGPGEQAAHDLAAAEARALGLEVRVDAALNLHMTLPGRDRAAPVVALGSHLDSVPEGGAYDGVAGVVAALAVLAGFVREGRRPARDLVALAIRCEEGAWFDAGYPGSSALLGTLDPAELDHIRRIDDGRSLGAHIEAGGGDLAALRARVPQLPPDRIAAYAELHIEQGPVLEAEGLPVGVVTGIRGCARHSAARCVGAYGHSGACPREGRRDAVAATAELIAALDAEWAAEPEALTVTFGVLNTDPAVAAGSKVAGETRFVLDLRALEAATMTAWSARARAIADRIEARRGVRFDLGPVTWSPPAPMDAGLVERMAAACARVGAPARVMESGAGHDAAAFAAAGVPSVMLFVRNANGSHNPHEAMDLADLEHGSRALAAFAADVAGA